MTRARAYLLAVIVAVGVLAAGTAFAVVRTHHYESTAVVALAPRADIPSVDVPSVIGSFDNSAAMGTYVELIQSKDTLRRAGSPDVTLDTRAVPASRVINVTATGAQDVVRPGLAAVLRAARAGQRQLNDAWQMQVIQAPQAATVGGPSTALIIAGSFVLAIFGAILFLVLLRHLHLIEQPRPEPLLPPEDVDELSGRGGLERHRVG